MQQHISKRQVEENRKIAEEQRQREDKFQLEKEKKAKGRKKFIAIVFGVLIVLGMLITYTVASPGKYDDFAKCLAEKGAVMYGEDWCQYTQGQKAMFGKSFKYINYEVKPNLRIRPTWIIDGKTYEKVQSFERLSALTGCKF